MNLSSANTQRFVYCITVILRSFSVGLIFVSHMVFAQDGQTDSEVPVNNKSSVVDEEEVRPVEVGVGGIIKPEKQYRTSAESMFEWHTHLLLESRYVTEGRDNLPGNHLLSASSEFTLDEIHFVPWVAYSAAADFSELDLNFIYGRQLTDNLIAYLGYNRVYVHYQHETVSDNEINFDMSYSWSDQFHVFTTIYHSFEADGSFIEAAVKSGHELNSDIYLDLQLLLGVNADFVADGHNGVNHFQLRADIAYQPQVKMGVYAYTAYSQAINRDAAQYPGDELLGDFFWAGVGFTYRF